MSDFFKIEPIEKCSHPKEKVKIYPQFNLQAQQQQAAMTDFEKQYFRLGQYAETYYQCECGARVQPKEFEAVE